MGEITVFSGSAHLELAQDICAVLEVECSPVRISRFSNDCLQVQLQANCRQRDVYIVQPLVPPTQEALMELLLMLDAARGASAAQITAVIPHYSYARSDKKDASRISIAGRLVADLLVAAGADHTDNPGTVLRSAAFGCASDPWGGGGGPVPGCGPARGKSRRAMPAQRWGGGLCSCR